VSLPDYSRLNCTAHGDPSCWAVLSDCGRYRYLLARTWDDYLGEGEWWDRAPQRALMVFVMLNPSTADGREDDPTIRKCIGFARRNGCGGILVVNLFAWRETHPKLLPRGPEVIGEHNEEFIGIALRNPLLAIGVAAWGRMSTRLHRQSASTRVAAQCARRLHCLGTTQDGSPRHPLMLPYSTPLESYVMRDRASRAADGRGTP
jgi:hypothetical protein